MKINQIWIASFGKLQNVSLRLESGANLFYGLNETGKSTIMAFIKAMLYGFPSRASSELRKNDRKHYTPWQGGTMGGSLSFSHKDCEYVIERTFGQKSSQDVSVCRNTLTGEIIDDPILSFGEQILKMTVSDYEDSICVKQQELRRTHDTSAIPKLLDDITANQNNLQGDGTDKAIMRLRRLKKELTNPRGNPAKLEMTVKELLELGKRREQAIKRATEEREAIATMLDLNDRIKSFEIEIQHKEAICNWLKARELVAKGEQYFKIKHKLQELESGKEEDTTAPTLPATILDQIYTLLGELKDVNREMRVNDEHIAQLERQKREQETNSNALLDFYPLAEREKMPDFSDTLRLTKLKKETNPNLLLWAILGFGIASCLSVAIWWFSNQLVWALVFGVVVIILVLVTIFWRHDSATRRINADIEAEKETQRQFEVNQKRWLEYSYKYKLMQNDLTKIEDDAVNCLQKQDDLRKRFVKLSSKIKEIAFPFVGEIDPFAIDKELSSWQKESRDFDFFQTQKEHLEQQLEISLEGMTQEAIVAKRAQGLNMLTSIEKDFPDIANEIELNNYQYDAVSNSLNDLQKKRQDLSSEWGSVDTLVRRFESEGDQIADLDRLIEAKNSECSSIQLECKAIDLAIEWINQATHEHAQNWLPRLTEAAEMFLQELCPERFSQIELNRDLESSRLKEANSPFARLTDYFSGATIDQVELALRMATTQMLLTDSEAILVLDDAFLQFDTYREHRALETLQRLAKSGWQILLFTCKDETRERSNKIGFHLARLQQRGTNT